MYKKHYKKKNKKKNLDLDYKSDSEDYSSN